MTNDKTVTMSRELAERLTKVFPLNCADISDVFKAVDELRLILAAPVVERQPCSTCGGKKIVDDGQLTHSSGGIPYENGPIKLVKDCPDCTSPPAPVAHTMKSVMSAICAINHFPMLTSNQCHALARSLNAAACLDKIKEMNR